MNPLVLTDAALEHQAAVYAANPAFRRLGCSFEHFLRFGPTACLRDYGGYPDVLPLLPAQERVRIRLAAVTPRPRRARAGGPAREGQGPFPALEPLETALEAAGCQVQGGRWIEKLRHRVWPRKRDRRLT
jgi:hypothetical protein